MPYSNGSGEEHTISEGSGRSSPIRDHLQQVRITESTNLVLGCYRAGDWKGLNASER